MSAKKTTAQPGTPGAPDANGVQSEKNAAVHTSEATAQSESNAAVNAKKATAQPGAPDASGAQGENSPPVHAKKQPRGLSRMLLAVCTGVLALAFSAIPALALWLNDAQLLAQPHERTGQAGALALTSDDLYLTRVLKKYAQRDILYGYKETATYPGSMAWAQGSDLRDQLNALYEAGVLSTEWRNYCIERIGGPIYTSQDSLGFTSYIAYVDNVDAPDYACYLAGVTLEPESQKVIGLFLSVDSTAMLPPMETDAVLAAYRVYLGLDAMEDWENPADTWFADTALYSARAELMLFCESGVFQTESYRGSSDFAGNLSSQLFDRSYFCMHALSLPEETVRAWQEYARSFPAGTNVWGKADPNPNGADAGSVGEWSEEEALG